MARCLHALLCLAASARALAPAATPVDRSVVLRKLGASGLGAALAATSLSPVAPAMAYEGVYGMETVKAKDAVRDAAAADSGDVRRAVKELNDMSVATLRIKSAVDADPNFDVIKCVRNDLNVGAVRSTFNALNAVYDEDTQKSTDRLQRGILQDLFEVEANAKMTPGTDRSPKKLAATKEKLDKLEQAFVKLDAFYL